MNELNIDEFLKHYPTQAKSWLKELMDQEDVSRKEALEHSRQFTTFVTEPTRALAWTEDRSEGATIWIWKNGHWEETSDVYTPQ